MNGTWSKTLVLTLMLGVALTPEAAAFEILTPASDPCHERITLGAFDIFAPFATDEDPSLSGLLNRMIDRAAENGVPNDDATRGAINHVVDVYNLEGGDRATKWVLASLLIGVRAPDTRGFSVVRINVTRTTHVADDLQDEHSLRRSQDDGEPGNKSAIENTRSRLSQLAADVHTGWWDSGSQATDAQWTLPHYGEQTVRVFAPAYRLGTMIHTIQDSFTHALRDDNGAIVHILNFVEASTTGVVESRDGLAHSLRLDECEIHEDSFDKQRVAMARGATVRSLKAIDALLGEPELDLTEFEAVLDEIYTLRDGCNLGNKYCDNGWVDAARTEQTEPIDIGPCGCSVSRRPPLGGVAVLSVLLTALAVVLRGRR